MSRCFQQKEHNLTSGVQQQHKPRDTAVKYYRYCTFIILGPTKGSVTEANHSLKRHETRSQTSRKGHWLFCVSKCTGA